MAAEGTVAIEATDLFSLGGNFNPVSSSTRTALDRAMIMDAVGNQQCETMINSRSEVTVSYAYCNASPDIKTDLALFATKFGDVQNSYIITQLVINYTAGGYATVDITGHQHTDATHAAGLGVGYADVSAAIPTTSGFGAPLVPGVTLGSNATTASVSITFSMNHVDLLAADGTHFVGKNITPTADISVAFEGVPTTAQPLTGWTSDGYGGDDSQSDFDKYEVTAHRYFDLATS